MKQLWSGIKSIVSIRKSSYMNFISKLKDSNGNVTSDPTFVASILDKFLINASHDTTKNITISNKSPVEFMGDRVGNSFFLAPLVLCEISYIISALKTVKCLGPNSTPRENLKGLLLH